jgi:putative MATE family efflux protein
MYYNTFSSILRAIGDSKTPLYFLILSSFLNVVGDYICVAILHWGVEGAAIATVFSQSFSAILSLIFIMKKYPEIWPQKEDWKYDGNMIKRLFAIGIPSGFHVSVISIGVLIVQANLNAFGSEAVAGFGVGVRIENLFVQSFVGFGAGLTTYCGQNIGAMQVDRVKEGVKKTLFLTSILAVINGIILYFFSANIAALFIDSHDSQVIQYTVTYTQTVGKFFVALTLIFIYRSSCQGLGSGAIPMFCAFEEIVFRVVAIIFIVPTFGYIGLCLASPFAWVATGLSVFVFYKILLKKIDKALSENKVLKIY